jgi:hypothetical protein
LLLHVCLYLSSLALPAFEYLPTTNQDIEVVYQNETTTPRQLVTEPTQDDSAEELIKKLQDQARHLSRITRRVKEEMVARQNGPTQNKIMAGSPTKNLSAATEMLDGEIETPSINKPMSNVGRNARMGDSSLAEYIPEVRTGGFTSLNTDQFVHYTFYARANEQLRNRWVSLIRDFIDSSPASEMSRLAQKTQMSQVEVVLTANGDFVKALLHQQSESRELDERTIAAFRMASPFNNPPSEMVGEDGYIRLHYGFYVTFRPRYVANGK